MAKRYVTKLGLALKQAGWKESLIENACKIENLESYRQILIGNAVLQTVRHFIDCDTSPYVPACLTIFEHRKGGLLEWKVREQGGSYRGSHEVGVVWENINHRVVPKRISGTKLQNELQEKSVPVLNANVLDYLQKNPELIPKKWGGAHVHFWGTVYRDKKDVLYVRYLCTEPTCTCRSYHRYSRVTGDYNKYDLVAIHGAREEEEYVIGDTMPRYCDWKTEEHTGGGLLKFDPAQILLYLDEQQKSDGWIGGPELRQKLKGKRVLNVNVRDFLYHHPYL